MPDPGTNNGNDDDPMGGCDQCDDDYATSLHDAEE